MAQLIQTKRFNMEDFIILHKSIIEDWKFQDEGILKFWILLLAEELEAQKDKDGLFEIRSLTKTTKKAGITRQRAHRLLKKMETNGDIEFLSSYFRGNEQKPWNTNEETTSKISINRKQPSGQFPGHKIGQFSTDTKASNEANIASIGPQKSDNFPDIKSDISLGRQKPEKTTPPTKEEEERAWRKIALRSALKKEIGYLKDDETVNSFFNQLSKEYDGSPDKEIQLAVRQNLLRKVFSSFKDTLEIKKAELYAKYKHNPYVMSPNTKKLCDDLLDPEFLEISKREVFQYNEQTMIKVNVRGPRKIGDVAKELVGQFSGDKTGQFSTNTKTCNEVVKTDSELEKPDNLAATKPDNFLEESTSTESDPSIQPGTELALKSINTNINTNIETNIEQKKENICLEGLVKRGCGGEKERKTFIPGSPPENLPAPKNENKISKVAEIHPDGRPAFSTKAFKSLTREEQIKIISERLSDLAETFPTIDVEFEFDHWNDWMAAKGRSFKDYSAAFRNWLRNVLVHASTNSPHSPVKVYNTSGVKLVTQEVFTNPAHVPFKSEPKRRPDLKPAINGGSK